MVGGAVSFLVLKSLRAIELNNVNRPYSFTLLLLQLPQVQQVALVE